MKYFRSPELAFWTAAILTLLALTVFAATRGADAVAGGEPTVPVAAPGATASDARDQVDALVALMPSGIAAGTNPAALRAFADAVRTQADAGLVVRGAEGADDDDSLLRGLRRVKADTGRLTAHADDPVAATALRTQVGLGVSHLHQLVLGLPAPDLPASGLDPFNSPDALDPATPAIPPKPATPTLGAKP